MNMNKITVKKNKPQKNEFINNHCIAVLSPDTSIENNNVTGVVNFIQKLSHLEIKFKIMNLDDGEHGFHIHKNGDLTSGCKSACEHFNPFNKTHGGLRSKNSHAGDLGNIISINKIAEGIIRTNKVSLDKIDNNIIGRMIIVHKDRDDLGKGGNEESLKTGNAGARLACGVIGIKN